jgi:hypothetical protein
VFGHTRAVIPPRLHPARDPRDDTREDQQRDPFPIPRWVINSPIHINNTVPAVNEITIKTP